MPLPAPASCEASISVFQEPSRSPSFKNIETYFEISFSSWSHVHVLYCYMSFFTSVISIFALLFLYFCILCIFRSCDTTFAVAGAILWGTNVDTCPPLLSITANLHLELGLDISKRFCQTHLIYLRFLLEIQFRLWNTPVKWNQPAIFLHFLLSLVYYKVV